MRRLRISELAMVVTISGPLAAPALSSSSGTDTRRPERFEGACEMSGVIRHQPPMTLQPARTKVRGTFTGVCSGTLIDRRGREGQVKDALARYEGRGTGELSCLGGTVPGITERCSGSGLRSLRGDARITSRGISG